MNTGYEVKIEIIGTVTHTCSAGTDYEGRGRYYTTQGKWYPRWPETLTWIGRFCTHCGVELPKLTTSVEALRPALKAAVGPFLWTVED